MSYKCKDCDLVFYSRDGLEVHFGRSHKKHEALDSFAEEQVREVQPQK